MIPISTIFVISYTCMYTNLKNIIYVTKQTKEMRKDQMYILDWACFEQGTLGLQDEPSTY